MSGMSIRTATFVGSSGLTNVRMLVTPRGPNTSSLFGEASQCSVSFTSWCPITVGIASPLVHGAAGLPHPRVRAYARFATHINSERRDADRLYERPLRLEPSPLEVPTQAATRRP